MSILELENTGRFLRSRKAFTLVEMITVVGLITIVLTIVLPTISSVTDSTDRSKTANLLPPYVALARTEALKRSEYVGLHIGLSDRGSGIRCYMAFVSGQFNGSQIAIQALKNSGAVAYPPKALPSPYAFGELSGNFVDGSGNFTSVSSGDSDGDGIQDALEDFTTFTILFSPIGTMVAKEPITYIADSTLFGTPAPSNDILWKLPQNDHDTTTTSALGATLVDCQILGDKTGSDWASYLNDNAEFMAFNSYTGEYFSD